MILTKHGFDVKINNVQHLEAIFDLIEGKWRVCELNWKKYFVYDDDIFTSELKKHQSFLSKNFYSYKNYKINDKIFEACSMSEFKIKLKEYEEEQKKLKVKEKKKEKSNNRGVYGIYCNDKLIYIGKTDIDFETRFKQHKEALKCNSDSQFLYKYLKVKCNESALIQFKPIINIKDLKVKNNITNRDIEAMELALIQLYQPICNIQGIKQEYKFTY